MIFLKKISKAISVMYRLQHVYPKTVLLIIYQSIINAHFTNGLLVWGSKINSNHPLHLLQKRALRIDKHTDYQGRQTGGGGGLGGRNPP